MGIEQVVKPSGLFTDPNPVGAVPKGALREALNIAIRRDGIAQPRPGFKRLDLVDDESDPADTAIVRMIQWENAVLGYEEDGSARFFDSGVDYGSSHQITGAAGTSFAARGVEARDNLYVVGENGLMKFTSTTAAPESVGLFGERCMTQAASASSFVDISYAYRSVPVRRDANGVVVSGSPTERAVVAGTATSPPSIGMIVILDTSLVEGDVIEVYRTVGSATAEPGDECFLTYSAALTSTNVANGFLSFTDTKVDDDLGKALYTNASQDGILRANRAPPRVRDVCLFKGSVFGANVRNRSSVYLEYIPLADASASATGIGRRTTTGDIVSGSPNITGIADTTGWAVGMLIYGSSGIPDGARVTAVGATTATISANATASANVELRTVDTIQMPNGEYFAMVDGFSSGVHVSPTSILSRAINIGQTSTGVWLSSTGAPSADYRAEPGEASAFFGTSRSAKVRIVTEEIDQTFGAINTTRPNETIPKTAAIDTAQAANADYVDTNEDINALIYSKTDQPEAMPYPRHLIRVGSSSFAIDRIMPTRDALWIFKRDGIFRLSGAGATAGWRVDPFDMTTFLIAVDSLAVLGDAIFAWTNRGVVSVSDSGVKLISGLSIAESLKEAEIYGLSQASQDLPFGAPASNNLAGGWAVSNAKNDEYILCVPSVSYGDGESFADPVLYVYNAKTLAWTRWNQRRDFTHGIALADGRLVLASTLDSGFTALSLERLPRGTTDEPLAADWMTQDAGVDPSFSLAEDLGGGYYAVELGAAVDDYVPAVGDLVLNGDFPLSLASSFWGIITEVASSTEFTMYSPDGAGTGARFYEAVPCEIEFSAKVDGNIMGEKSWQGGAVLWGTQDAMDRYTMEFRSSIDTAAETSLFRVPGWPDNADTPSTSRRFWVPRNHARASVLYPKVSVAQAGSQFQIHGLAIGSAYKSYQALR